MIQRTHSPLAVVGKTIQMLLLLAYALFALFPLLWMVIMSLKPDSQMLTTTFIFTPTLENYATVLRSDYTRFFFNNLIEFYSLAKADRQYVAPNHSSNVWTLTLAGVFWRHR